ncbi:TKL protein kinase [Phytophthora nicotianae P10297]|uniref:TKL protein kinase n=1 Tax=Phytophthora nicotianae P10297 TaxID=1317064 RepID=W2YJA1_PHYNI|nr:TKL protein kinase [Phytophthora nicotianae P10297]
MQTENRRHLAASKRYQDADFPSDDGSFVFDGTNSDLARQLYFRANAEASVSQFNNLEIPSAVQDRLDELDLDWNKLPGIAQRALLWDSGFGLTASYTPVKIWTLNNHTMANLAVPLEQVRAVGCEEKACVQPDNTTSYSNEWCGGAQLLQAARCVVEDFVDTGDIHAAMWVTGGNPIVIPTPHVLKHEWKDQRDKNSYIVFAIHTLDSDDEPAWNTCPDSTQNDGYGSLVVPCFTTDNITNATMEAMKEVEGSPWVSRWLVEDYSTPDEHEFKMILLVPIIGGIVATIGLLGLLIIVKQRRQRQPKSTSSDGAQICSKDLKRGYRNSNQGLSSHHPANNSTFGDFEWTSSTLRETIGSESLLDKRIPYDSIHFERVVSKGASGEVWLADFQGQQVAVKRLLQSKTHSADEVEEFAQEIQLSASLTHPNIVGFIGVAWNSLTNLVMVLEFLPLGDLQAYLRKNFDLLLWSKDKIHIAIGIALALEYLHSRSPPIIHRDLKSRNILISKRLEPKLSDFGVSRTRQENIMTAGVGTPYWSAPEILEGKQYTELADIYSFGVVLSELDTAKLPYHDALTPEGKSQKPFKILAEVITGVLRPTFSKECSPQIRRIGVACCQHDPDRRPTAAQVLEMLRQPSD